jgi:hypothetical protein
MYEGLSYEKLKELPGEQKKNALMELKQRYPHYKEMAEKIGGTPTALSNLYLRIVEGKRFGRKKKAEMEPAIIEPAAENEIKVNHTRRKSVIVPDSRSIAKSDMTKSLTEIPVKKAFSFTINLDIDESGNEAKSRIEGIIGSLLKDKTYRIKLGIEEV